MNPRDPRDVAAVIVVAVSGDHTAGAVADALDQYADGDPEDLDTIAHWLWSVGAALNVAALRLRMGETP